MYIRICVYKYISIYVYKYISIYVYTFNVLHYIDIHKERIPTGTLSTVISLYIYCADIASLTTL